MKHFSLISFVLVLFLTGCGLLSEKDKKKEDYPAFKLIKLHDFNNRPITEVYINSKETNYVGTWEGITFELKGGDIVYLNAELTSRASRIKEINGKYYAKSGNSSFITSIDGKKWTEVVEIKEPLFDYVVLESGRIVLASFEGVYYKDPGDNEWTNKKFFFAGSSISYPNNVRHLVATKNGVLVVGTHDGMYRSLDEGENWEKTSDKISKVHDDISQLLAKENGEVIAYADQFAFLSRDDGATWSTYTLPNKGDVPKAVEDNGIEYAIFGAELWARRSSNDLYVNLEILKELEKIDPQLVPYISNFYLRGNKIILYNSMYPSAIYTGTRVQESDIWDKF
ncbi:MAG: sialidase family protein [Balneolaceae bacterium]